MRKGVSLVEIVISMLLLSLVGVAVLSMEVSYWKMNKRMALLQEATMILQEEFEDFKRTINRTDLIKKLGKHRTYNSTNNPNVIFTVRFSSELVNLPNIDPYIVDSDRKGILQIDGTVNWVDSDGNHSISMFTRSNY